MTTESSDRFAIAFPEAGEAATVRFNFSDYRTMTLETSFAGVVRQLDGLDEGLVQSALTLALKNADPAVVLDAVPMAMIASRLLDALFVRVYGRTVAEQAAHVEAERAALVATALAAQPVE